jgi:hypothetical protein
MSPAREKFLKNMMGVLVLASVAMAWYGIRHKDNPPAPAGPTSHSTPSSPQVVLGKAQDLRELTVRGKEIIVGVTTADEVFEILHKSDEDGPQALTVGNRVHYFYEVDGQKLGLTFARTEDPGPYVVVEMFTRSITLQ